MSWPRFSTDHAELQAEIEAAKATGPDGLAHLNTLCVWKVSHQCGPEERSRGPSGLPPIPDMSNVLARIHEAFRAGEKPIGYCGWDVPWTYPRPAKPHQSERLFGEAEARQIVADALDRTRADGANKGAARHRAYTEIMLLWQRGLTLAELEPLLKLVTAIDDSLTVEVLIKIGETESALHVLSRIFDDTFGVLRAVNCLISVGETADAERILDELWKKGGNSEPKWRGIAESYAYLGNPARALEIAEQSCERSWFDLEAVIALNQYYKSGQADSSAALKLLENVPLVHDNAQRLCKRLASYLEFFLLIEDYDAAWIALHKSFQTLLMVPTRNQFDFRLEVISFLLAPQVEAHPEQIYDFVQNILTTTAATPGVRDGLWRMSYAVSCCAWLIFYLSPEQEVNNLLEFAWQWSQGIIKD